MVGHASLPRYADLLPRPSLLLPQRRLTYSGRLSFSHTLAMAYRGSSSRKVAGLSKAAVKHGYRGLTRHSKLLPASKQGQRIEEVRTRRRHEISGEYS
jgi:hypothetical protein